MEWHQIENFIAVAKQQNFTKAAQSQNISQPALSRSILKLESELGVSLIFRESRPVKLTRYGEFFLKKALQAQTSLQEGIVGIQDKISLDTGEISVAFLHTLGAHLIPNLIANYKRIYPNVTFQLYQGSNDYVLKQVEQGIADLCLSLQLSQNNRIQWTTLKKEPLYLVVPKEHSLANQSKVSFGSLKEEEFICFKKGYGLRYIFDEMCQALNVFPKITFEGEEVLTVAGFIQNSLGLAVLPKISDIMYENLRFIEISDYHCQRTIALATLDHSFLSPIATKFKSFVIENFNN